MRVPRLPVLMVLLLVPLTACKHSAGNTAAGVSTPAVNGSVTTAASAGTASAPRSSASATPAQTTSGSAAPRPSTGAVPMCAESQLRASIDPRHIPGNGTPGKDGRVRHAVLIDFQNTSTSTCVLNGYPGAAIVDEAGRQVRQAVRTLNGGLLGLTTGQHTAPPVTLAPRAYAAAGVEGVDEHDLGTVQAGCDAPRYPRILVTPPNTEIPVPFTVGWPRCYSFEVHAVRALPDGPEDGLAAFVGSWTGHTRLLTVAPDGTANASVNDGCCTLVYTSQMRLTNARGNSTEATATAVLTQVHVTPGQLGDRPMPKVGDSKTISIRNGILTDPFFDVIFCDDSQGAQASCGA